jgi:hypothetical protein
MSATSRAELESRLRERWDLEDLAIYADVLQIAGERHGELIAIDLQLRRARSDDLEDRRRTLLRDWLGQRLATKLADAEFGMVDHVTDDPEQLAILDSPFGAFVRAASISATAKFVQAFLERIARAPRPWLTRLEVDVKSLGSSAAFPPALVSSLLVALPHLAELTLRGDVSLDTFPHPELRTLRIDHPLAIRSLCSARSPLPAVTHLELGGAMRVSDPSWLSPEALPALSHLDLSQFAPVELHVCAALRDAPFSTLRSLVLATVPSPASEAALIAALAQMPQLAEVRILRRDYDLSRLAAASPVIRLPAMPWPEAFATACAIAVTVPPGIRIERPPPPFAPEPRRYGEEPEPEPPPYVPPPQPAARFVVDASAIMPWLDTKEHVFSDVVRATWQAVIAALVDVLESGTPRTFPIDALVELVSHGTPPHWEALATALRYWEPSPERVATLSPVP